MAETESTPEESGARRRRYLADGRISRSYVPLEVEALEAPISAEAIGLLMRIRLDSQQRERDGAIDKLALQAVAAYCQLPTARLAKLLKELADAGLLKLASGGAHDLNYSVWGRTRGEREDQREKWRGRKRRSRQDPEENPPGVTPMSRRDMSGNPNGVTALSPTIEVEVRVDTPNGVSSPSPPAPDRADVDQLCQAMSDSVVARGAKRPTVTTEWRREARRLLDLDRRPLDEALDLIAWSAADSFWRANVLSLPKFREKYDQLRLQQGRPAAPAAGSSATTEPRHRIAPEDSAQMQAWMAQGRGGVQ